MVECRFLAHEQYKPRPDVLTYGWAGGSYFYCASEDGMRVETLVVPTEAYSLAAERKLLAGGQSWLLPEQSIAVQHSGTEVLVWSASKTGPKAASVPATTRANATGSVILRAAFTRSLGAMFTVQFPDASWVRASMHPTLPRITAFDGHGRIIAFDAERPGILFRNDGK